MNLSTGIHQDITIWRSTPDGFGGYSFAAPVVSQGKWSDKSELLPGSSTEMSLAVIHFPQQVNIGVEDYVYLGISAASDPTTVPGTRRVRSYKRTPDLRNLEAIQKIWLI